MNHKRVSDTWQLGDAYDQYVGRWSRRVAPLFLDWLRMPRGRRWLDIGCGTGALSAAIQDACAPSSLIGIEPSDGFLASARRQLGGRALFQRGSATAIPLADASVDLVVSGLVLNFIPDQPAALSEMARVTTRGGTIAAYVWDCAGKMELMRFFWDAAVRLDAGAAPLDEGVRFPLCRPEVLTRLFDAAGLQQIAVTAIDIPTPFSSFKDYWLPFLGGYPELVVAKSAGQVFGFAVFGPSRDEGAPDCTAEIMALCLSPDVWSIGVGRRLWCAVLDRVVAQGFAAVTLWVMARNARAIRLYEAAGFAAQPSSCKQFTLGGLVLDEVRYQRRARHLAADLKE